MTTPDNDSNSKIDLIQKYFFDATRDSMFGYWGALLTVNGILISVFVAVAILQSGYQTIISAILLCSLVPSFLLIRNYGELLQSFRFQGGLLDNLFKGVHPLSDQDMQRNIKEAEEKHQRIITRERVAVKLVLVEGVLIALLLA
jgi:hypothetical protein